MVYDVIMSICMNISLLIVLALMLTKIEFVKVLLLNGEEEERNDRKTGTRKVRNQLVLGGIFGIFCVISDYIGIHQEYCAGYCAESFLKEDRVPEDGGCSHPSS